MVGRRFGLSRGSLTLLFQEANGTGGLEVFLPDQLATAATADPSATPYLLAADVDQTRGKWYGAPNLSDTVLVNVGLQMEAWTGGLAKATLHRVVPAPAPGGGFQARKVSSRAAHCGRTERPPADHGSARTAVDTVLCAG